MISIKDQAAKILERWYWKSPYDIDHMGGISHDELKSSEKNLILNDKELILELNKKGTKFILNNNIKLVDFVSSELKNDKELMLALIRTNGHNLELINEEFKSDKEFVLAAVNSTRVALKYANEKFLNDDDVLKCIILKFPHEITNAPIRIKKDREFISKLVKMHSGAWVNIDDEFKNDVKFLLDFWIYIKEIMKDAINSDYSLNYNSKILLDNMSEDIKPFFNSLNKNTKNQDFIKEMDISFNRLVLHEELSATSNKPNKKMKV
jgi:hypothetical protein